MAKRKKSPGERLFEEYLSSVGLCEWEYERRFKETKKRPDYAVHVGNEDLVCDVKEYAAQPWDFKLGSGAYDPLPLIRNKLQDAEDQMGDLRGKYACAVVLHNSEKPLVDLEVLTIYSALLDLEGGRAIEARYMSLGAVVVLERMPVGERRFVIRMCQLTSERGHEFTALEWLAEAQAAENTERDVSLREVRTVVFENPFAQPPQVKPVPREFGVGALDERWVLTAEGRFNRVYAGAGVVEFERQESSADVAALTTPLGRLLRR